jgi:hypothetical protein
MQALKVNSKLIFFYKKLMVGGGDEKLWLTTGKGNYPIFEKSLCFSYYMSFNLELLAYISPWASTKIKIYAKNPRLKFVTSTTVFSSSSFSVIIVFTKTLLSLNSTAPASLVELFKVSRVW